MSDTNRPISTGDLVYHEPTGLRETVAYADHDTGWLAFTTAVPQMVRIQHCRVVQTASDEQSWALVELIAAMPGSDHRAVWCRRALREREQVQDGG